MQPKPSEWIPLNGDTIIRSPEKELLEKEAIAGSASAALKLGTSLTINEGNSDETIYWLQIAVENGSRQAIYNLATALLTREEPQKQARGRYWLEEIMRNGPVEDRASARFLLEDLDRKKK